MNYRVVFSPQTQDHLVELFRYIAEVAFGYPCPVHSPNGCGSGILNPGNALLAGRASQRIPPGVRIVVAPADLADG